jgi:hypothetical protein
MSMAKARRASHKRPFVDRAGFSSSAGPGRNPAAIRDLLPARDRTDFAKFFSAALDEARRIWSLQPVDEVLEQWRRIAIFSRQPGHAESVQRGLRMLAGEDLPARVTYMDALREGN